jgi:tetratricopeptide (TPR) repeat protein
MDAATPAERALMEKLDNNKYVKARDEAEALMASSPDSFLAVWAMTQIQHLEEANHARALFYVHRAEALLLKNFGRDPKWHKKVLIEETEILFEMDRNEEGLAELDRQDKLYGPASPERRIWALFKLGRVDEARAIARKMAASDEYNDRAVGFNSMMAIEFEAHNREEGYRWSVDGIRATADKDCVILRNGAGAAYIRFRLAEAEDFALRAHKAQYHCVHSGYDQLAGLYLVEGEFNRALDAINQLKGEKIEKRVRPHYALTRREILSEILYALGKVEEAEKMSGELYGLPARTGETSGSKAMERLIRSFRYFIMLDTRLVLARERASYRPILASVTVDNASLVAKHWEVRRALLQLLAEGDLLVSVAQPNLQEISDWNPWKNGSLVDIVGAGVLKAAIVEARARDAKFPEAGPYLDALEGEIAWRDGEWERADRLATAALHALPREELLMHWRTLAYQADALRKLGREDAARPLMQEVLSKFPSVLRILDIRVPVSIESDGSALAVEAADKLTSSSRFDAKKKAPFKIQAGEKTGLLQICLIDDKGTQFACATNDIKEKDKVLSALDAFHSAAFSPKVDLKQTDLNSLDGSPVRVTADEVLKGVIGP